MADMEQAKKVYATLVNMLDAKGWKYDKHEDDLVITSCAVGDDIPVEFIVAIDAERELVRFLSKMPFTIAEDKLIDGALAVCVANNSMVDGSFDYDITDGSIMFRLTSSYRGGSILSEDLLEYVVMLSVLTVDKYNDKFLMLSKGVITLEQFMKSNDNS